MSGPHNASGPHGVRRVQAAGRAGSMAAEAWGEEAVLFTATDALPEDRWRTALALHRGLAARCPDGATDWVHAFESVLVTFDCTQTDAFALIRAVQAIEADADATAVPAPRRFTIPVRFGGHDGPDLDAVAAEVGCSPAELVERIVADELVIGTVGGNAVPLMFRMSAAGSSEVRSSEAQPGRARPPHGKPAEALRVARMRSPRAAVPAGSFGLAGDRTCIYPVEAPGGWRLVGRTPLALVDPASDPIVRYRAGDLVRIVPVRDDAEAARLAGAPLVETNG